MTNEEMMQKIFPDMEIEIGEIDAYVWINHEPSHFDKTWWNAEYKEPNYSEIPTGSMDYISKQEVVGLMMHIWGKNFSGDDAMQECIDAIRVMPSVTLQIPSELEKNSKKLEKNFGELDCISRADAIRVASGYCHPSNVAKELAKLPSVTTIRPKGHWIEQIDYEENCRTLICSNCDRPALHDGDSIWKHKFCPHCGADMREVEV